MREYEGSQEYAYLVVAGLFFAGSLLTDLGNTNIILQRDHVYVKSISHQNNSEIQIFNAVKYIYRFKFFVLLNNGQHSD